MNVFSWLLLGHLLGDWLLQNDWMAQGKKKGLITLAGIAHFTVYTVAILSVLWLTTNNTINAATLLTIGVTIFVSHWVIDATVMIDWWMQFYGQTNQIFVRIMIDQTLHLLVLGMLAMFFFSYKL